MGFPNLVAYGLYRRPLGPGWPLSAARCPCGATTWTPCEVETCAQLLRASLTDAREALEAAYGPDPTGWTSDPTGWTWETAGRVELTHLGFGLLPVLGRLFWREVVLPGGPDSLFNNVVGYLNAPHRSPASFQSSDQGIDDRADLDAVLFMTGGGASGHFQSPYDNNLTPKWAPGERIRLNPDTRVHAPTLVLLPLDTDP